MGMTGLWECWRDGTDGTTEVRADGAGDVGTVPREAAEHIKALAVAPVQVQAEDRRENKHHSCKVAADHYGHLGDRQEGHKGWMKQAPGFMLTWNLGPFLRPHLQGEGPQCRDGNEGGHEEGNHVADGCERDAGPGALQTLACALLPGQGRSHGSSRQSGGEAWELGMEEGGP